MPIIADKYCSRCRKHVPAVRKSPNHVLHAIMTLLVCGLWIPIWILAALNQTYHCPNCGKVATSTVEKIVFGAAVLMLILLGPLAVWSVINASR